MKGGMRGVGFAALLGLDDFRRDAFATGYACIFDADVNIRRQRSHFPVHVFVRSLTMIRSIRWTCMKPQLLQVVCAYRLFMPFSSITVSTRECERVRNSLIKIAATKISAGVNVGIGGHSGEEKGDEQFEIDDTRSVDEVYQAIIDEGLQPVMNDYIYV